MFGRPQVESIVCPVTISAGSQFKPAPVSHVSASAKCKFSSSSEASGPDPLAISQHVQTAKMASVTRHFSFLTWNVKWLLPKLNDYDFVSFVRGFDFICLCETFIEKFQSNVFVGFKDFWKPAVKFTKHGRRSGGIVCLIRLEYMPFVKYSEMSKYKNCCVFLIDKKLFGTDKDVLYVCTYIQPEGSQFYDFFGYDNGISLLEDCLTDCALGKDLHIIVCGDFNSRTSNFTPDLSFSSNIDIQCKSQSCVSERHSEDTYLNNYGKLFLNVCAAFDLSVLNGLCKGDPQGRYTFVSHAGCSVTDYFLFSYDLLSMFFNDCELRVLERIDSDHMPVVARVSFPFENKCNGSNSENERVVIRKFVWNDANAGVYYDNLCNDATHVRLIHAMDLVDVDINKALDVFNECIKQCATCMKKDIIIDSTKPQSGWFDQECTNKKRFVRKMLRISRRSLNANDRHAYLSERREYKKLLERKKKEFNRTMLNKLVSSIKNQKDFWNTVHKASFRKRKQKGNISLDMWYQHFKSLLEVDLENSNSPNTSNDDLIDDETSDYLDRPISKEEILLALRKLKSGKAAGPDEIIGEMLRNSNELVINFFLKLFNTLFEKSIFPNAWTGSIILPLFKKGDVHDPTNYRGISLCDLSSKLFSSIINNRLQEWVEENNVTGEQQAGFKKGYSTIDHMFTLLALVQKQFSYNRKLYVAFIDFEKAFDSINRNLLWPILSKNGIKGKLLGCIKSMYNVVRSRVKHGDKFTNYISCKAGVKQGDVCSPVLFSIFINELALEVIRNGRHGAMFKPDAFELFILLLADDIVLLSETVVGLQTQLNSLSNAAASLQLKVNLNKSNIIVFRKGGYLGAREKWVYNSLSMPVVNIYKYLGIFFSTRLSFSAACKDLASKAKNALLCIMQRLYALNNNSLELFLKLFDSQVRPIAQYGCEIWGLDKAAVHSEAVHLFAIKKYLGVDIRTPNDLVYGETNRYPTYVNSTVSVIRYWIRLVEMKDHRLPYKAYFMLHNLDANGKNNWVTNVRCCLNKYGFGHVWLNQGVGCSKSFLSAFRQRLIDCNWQNWNEHISNSDRFSTYRSFCWIHDVKSYLLLDIDRHIKSITTKFRLGVSSLFVHYFRYRKFQDSDLICPLCKISKEDEVHFVLVCQALSHIREALIPLKYFEQPSFFSLCLLLTCRHMDVAKRLSLYLYKAFKLRDLAISKASCHEC